MNSNSEFIDPSMFILNGDFEAQVYEVLAAIRLSRDEIEDLRPLLFHVNKIVNILWPGKFSCLPVLQNPIDLDVSNVWIDAGSEVVPFGSIVTGLGIKTSDIDICVKLPENCLENVKTNASDYVKRLGWKLRCCENIYQNVFCIYNAKVPIVKLYHVPTRKNCDVSFTSRLGVYNSQLIGHLLNLDQRVRPLAILVKYWSKVYKLTGTNLVPNYGLTLLVIFYLQTKKILPSLLTLQKNVKPQFVENWNVAYDTNIKNESTTESLYELLGGFFQYYDAFDFMSEMIAPYLGYPIKRGMFADKDTVPRTYMLYRSCITSELCKPINVEGAMCVQDPIQHDRNCTQGVSQKLFLLFKHHLNVAAALFRDVAPEDYLRQLLTTPSKLPPITRRTKKSKAKRGVSKPSFKKQNRFGNAYYKFYRNESKMVRQELENVYESIQLERNIKQEFKEQTVVTVKQENNVTVVKSEVNIKNENS